MEYSYRVDVKEKDWQIHSIYFSSEIDEINEELLHSMQLESGLWKIIKIVQE